MPQLPIPKTLTQFLADLRSNNDRTWFAKNKSRYDQEVMDPALALVAAFQKPLEKAFPVFQAIPKRVGGSIMRVYRDTRFSSDKTPYKTNLGIQFRHELGRDVHSPGFYIHIEPNRSFLGTGIWHPDSGALKLIRDQINSAKGDWKKTSRSKTFQKHFQLAGDSLSRPPKGYSSDHPEIEDLKRKDFIGVKSLSNTQIHSPRFVAETLEAFRASGPFVRFLCTSLNLPY